jgi:hypothetical protein
LCGVSPRDVSPSTRNTSIQPKAFRLAGNLAAVYALVDLSDG